MDKRQCQSKAGKQVGGRGSRSCPEGQVAEGKLSPAQLYGLLTQSLAHSSQGGSSQGQG